MGECMECPVEYAEQDFDCNPLGVRRLTTDELITNSRSCNLCRAPITPPGDYGYWCWSETETDEDEPEWVALCWGCARAMVYGESDERDPRTGKRASDGLENLKREGV